MVSKRNRIIDLVNYFTSLGIEVNIGKNKAQGHAGFFRNKNGKYRIDIAKDMSEEKQLSVLLHEFSHFIHYKYDKTLNNLDFIFENYSDDIEAELLEVTVNCVPKDFAKSLYQQQASVKEDIGCLIETLKKSYPEFKPNINDKTLENKISKTLKYLLKYDCVLIDNKRFNIENLNVDFVDYSLDILNYVKLKSKQRLLKRINRKISNLNRYYNMPTELFARFIEQYFCNPLMVEKCAPLTTKILKNKILNRNISELSKINDIVNL